MRPALRLAVVGLACLLGALVLREVPPPVAAVAMVPVEPARLRIPAIGVDAPMSGLGLRPDRTLEVPADARTTGWWEGGARPGAPGAAVVVGHVGSAAGPAVFQRLHELDPGDVVEVIGPTGDVARFGVESLATHPEAEFPTEAVYGPTSGPALRLVTCAGDVEDDRMNTIAYAAPVPA